MNKNEMIKEVQQQFGYDENFSQKVISIFESCSEIGQKGKDQVVSRYVKELNIGETEANNIFDCVLNLTKRQQEVFDFYKWEMNCFFFKKIEKRIRL